MVDEQKEKGPAHGDALRMTSEVVAAYLKNNDLPADQIPHLINTVFSSFKDLEGPIPDLKLDPPKPAVSVRKSIAPEYIICLEDGKRLKMLKRHLRTIYNMSPDDYRAKWGLPPDYPMVAPNYAKQRSDFAKQIGLGRGVATEGATRPGRRRRAGV